MQGFLVSFSLLLLFFLHSSTTAAQSPTPSPSSTPPPPPPPAHHKAKPPAHAHAHAPAAPSGPADTIQILLKAGHFTAFVRLIKATHVDTQLFSQLNSSTDGITVLAPNDNAFSNLREGALGSLNDRQKVEFVQFHCLPRFLTPSDFQTLSNPVRTLAGSGSRFPLTITTTDNTVTITSGPVKTSIKSTIYSDKQIAIYEVDKVLLPKDLFPPAPAQAPAKVVAESPVVPKDVSGAEGYVFPYDVVVFGLVVAALFSL